MTKIKNKNSDMVDFIDDLTNVMFKLSKRHGVDISSPSIVKSESDGLFYINFVCSESDLFHVYADFYRTNCETVGLPEHWLGQDFFYDDDIGYLKIIGLDPNFNESIVKLSDSTGELSNLRPSEVFYLMSESVNNVC